MMMLPPPPSVCLAFALCVWLIAFEFVDFLRSFCVCSVLFRFSFSRRLVTMVANTQTVLFMVGIVENLLIDPIQLVCVSLLWWTALRHEIRRPPSSLQRTSSHIAWGTVVGDGGGHGGRVRMCKSCSKPSSHRSSSHRPHHDRASNQSFRFVYFCSVTRVKCITFHSVNLI